jgi:hypothetical protein
MRLLLTCIAFIFLNPCPWISRQTADVFSSNVYSRRSTTDAQVPLPLLRYDPRIERILECLDGIAHLPSLHGNTF